MKKCIIIMITGLVFIFASNATKAQAQLSATADSRILWSTLQFGGIGEQGILWLNKWEFAWAVSQQPDGSFVTQKGNNDGWISLLISSDGDLNYSDSNIDQNQLTTSLVTEHGVWEVGYADGHAHRSGYFQALTTGILTISVQYELEASASTETTDNFAFADAEAYGRLGNNTTQEVYKDKASANASALDGETDYISETGTLYLEIYLNAGEEGYLSLNSYSTGNYDVDKDRPTEPRPSGSDGPGMTASGSGGSGSCFITLARPNFEFFDLIVKFKMLFADNKAFFTVFLITGLLILIVLRFYCKQINLCGHNLE